MSTVTSAYNFVPINKKVCLPDWADFISQDIPLQEAKSGVIDLTITAKTPIFVRGESTVSDPEVHQEYEFMKHNGQYCIPGSSIKGTIASVLEILSFGKLNRINNPRFSQRDWDNKIIYKKTDFAKNKGGWLYRENGEYKIKYSIKKIGRIEHEAIDKSHYATDFEEIFGKNFDISTEDKSNEEKEKAQFLKSARYKYELLGIETFKFEKKFCITDHKKNLFEIHENGFESEKGTLVVTGQSNQRKYNEEEQEWEGKNKEFIFWEPKKIQNVNDLMEDFLFAYFDNDPKQRTTDWNYWRKVLDEGGEVPVFLQLDDSNRIKHFGLSMLYKLPYKKKVKDMRPNAHINLERNENETEDKRIIKNDFVETLFGHSINKKSKKGRISFLPAFANEISTSLQAKTLILGGPKASYYPFYLRQNLQNVRTTRISGKYLTYDDSTTLAGRKRYPIKKVDISLENEKKTAFSTTFTPLPAGTIFKSKIIYHNLLPEELGALLCALTFNGVNDCHHGIGMAKPYGYGAVTIDVEMDIALRNETMLAFRAYMEAWYRKQNPKKTWSDCEQLQELIAMSRFTHQTKKLSYMDLKMFSDVKDPKNGLPKFTNFLGINPYKYSKAYFDDIQKVLVDKIVNEEVNTLEKGLIELLNKESDYGKLKEKMNSWLSKRDHKPITEKLEIEEVKSLVKNIRNKKKSSLQKKFFKDNKVNDLIRWIGKEETEKFIQSFK